MSRPRQISDKEILVAARAVFLEHGHQVSTAVIAQRVGISQALLFQRFGTKQRMLVAALWPAVEPDWFERVRQGPDERNLVDQLQELAGEVVATFEQHVPCLVILRSAGIDLEGLLQQEDTPHPVQGFRAIQSWFDQARQDGRIGSGDSAAAALVFLGALQTNVFLAHLAGERTLAVDEEPWWKGVVELLWNGLRPGGEQ